jgi:hypothetical protein
MFGTVQRNTPKDSIFKCYHNSDKYLYQKLFDVGQRDVILEMDDDDGEMNLEESVVTAYCSHSCCFHVI